MTENITPTPYLLNLPPKYEALVLASNKKELLPIVIALFGLSLDNIGFIDPEKPSVEAEFMMEPESKDPFEAVKFKLIRILKLFEPTWEDNKELVLYASDVVFSTDGKHFLKPSRDGDNLDVKTVHQELIERYEKPFLAEWNVAFGIADSKGVNMGNIKVEADYPSLTETEIYQNFLPSSNAGLELVEIGIEKGLSFKLFLGTEQDPIIIEDQEGYQLLYQFIVQKLPTVEMFHSLVKREIATYSECYGLIAQSFFTLERYSGLSLMS